MNSSRRVGFGRRVRGFLVLAVMAGAVASGTRGVAAHQSAGQAAKSADQAELLLQAARAKQVVEGKLDEAIALYRQVVSTYGQNHAAAAQALVAIGQCYEKLGAAQAAKALAAYEEIVSKYPDQSDAVRQARGRLAALQGGRPGAMATRRVATVSDWGDFGSSALSPDGHYLAFADYLRRRVTILNLQTGDERSPAPPAAPAAAVSVAVAYSPDGRQLATAWIDFQKALAAPTSPGGIPFSVVVSEADGTKPRTIWSGSGAPKSLCWLSDGGRIVVAMTELAAKKFTFTSIGVADQSVRPVETTLGVGTTESFSLAPNGRLLAYLRTNEQPPGTAALVIRDVQTGMETRVSERIRADALPTWTPDGASLLFVDGRAGAGDLWMVRVVDGRVQGGPLVAKTDVGDVLAVGASRDGAFYYRTRTTTRSDYVVAVDPKTAKPVGAPAGITTRVGQACGHDWSPDGASVLYGSRAITNSGDGCTLLVLQNLADGRERVVSTDLTELRHPRLSPDGRTALVFGSKGEKGFNTYRIDMTNGAATLFAEDAFAEWSPDGKGVYLGMTRGASRRIVFRDLQTGTETERYSVEAPVNIYFDDFAPSADGSLSLLVVNSRTGVVEAVVVPPAGPPRSVLSASRPDVISCIAWSSDGKALWATRHRAEKPSEVELVLAPLDGGVPIKAGAVLPFMNSLRASPDGKRLLFIAGSTDAGLWALENFLSAKKGR